MDNPYNYHVAVQNDKLFFGHEDMQMRLNARLSAPTPNSAAIIGGRRCGKSSLLNKLARDMLHKTPAPGERYLVPCVLDLQCGRPLSCPDDFFMWLLEKLGEAWDRLSGSPEISGVETLKAEYRDEVPRGRAEAFTRAFRSLDTQGQRIRLVALVDEWEVLLQSTWGNEVRPNLRYLLTNSTITKEIALVIAGSTFTYEKVADQDSPLENVLDRYLLPPLSLEATLSLAQVPNGGRLSQEALDEIWHQTGGHPCMTQYILYELWDAFTETTRQDVQDAAATFDQVTRHCSAWTLSLGQEGYALYCFLIDQPLPVPFFALRQKFITMPSAIFQSKLDALVYHGLVHCIGRGKKLQYQIAGHLYQDWLLSEALSFNPGGGGEQSEPRSLANFYGDIVLGLKQVGVDERQQQVHGSQTNIAGDVHGPVFSGQFSGPIAVGGGEAVDLGGSQGAVYEPTGPVEQQFGSRISITGDGNVIGNSNRVTVVKQTTTGATMEEFRRLIAELKQGLAQAGLDSDIAEIVAADLRTIEEQAGKDKPRGSIIVGKLKSITEMLTAVAGTAAATGQLLPLAQKAVEWAGQLFH